MNQFIEIKSLENNLNKIIFIFNKINDSIPVVFNKDNMKINTFRAKMH